MNRTAEKRDILILTFDSEDNTVSTIYNIGFFRKKNISEQYTKQWKCVSDVFQSLPQFPDFSFLIPTLAQCPTFPECKGLTLWVSGWLI